MPSSTSDDQCSAAEPASGGATTRISLRALAGDPPLDLLEESPAADGLVRDHQDPVDVVVGRDHVGRTRQRPARALVEHPDQHPQLDPEQDRAGQRIDDQRHGDHQPHRDPDDHDDPEHLRFGPQGIVHSRLLT